MSRAETYTNVVSLAERLAEWEKSVESTRKHIALGKTLQSQGLSIIKNNQDQTELSIKIIQQATQMIERGVKLERDSCDKLSTLMCHRPMEKRI